MTVDPIRAFERGASRGRALVHSLVVVVLGLVVAVPALAGDPQPPALRLPPDAVYDRVVGPDSAVVFRHGTHVALASNRCTECHTRLFRILGPTVRISHADMNAGRSCGGCHDGRHAFGVHDKASCGSCHTGRPSADVASTPDSARRAGGPAGFRGPAPIVYAASEVSPGTVTFRHATHAKGDCSVCHPKLFAMKSSAAKPRDGMHEATACGACHDGKHAFSVENEASCERCHQEQGGER
jgi:c(7)-type cytochrome triheme protein